MRLRFRSSVDTALEAGPVAAVLAIWWMSRATGTVCLRVARSLYLFHVSLHFLYFSRILASPFIRFILVLQCSLCYQSLDCYFFFSFTLVHLLLIDSFWRSPVAAFPLTPAARNTSLLCKRLTRLSFRENFQTAFQIHIDSTNS